MNLEKILLDQLEIFKKKDFGVLRDIDFSDYLKSKQIVVISGIRRAGKSVLLKQFSENFEKIYYINFDDERLIDFQIENFQDLMLNFQKLYDAKTIFIDEIQNVPNWERFIRRIHDEGYKIFITGSNSKLLSSELSTHLTGRYKKIELYPFSFKEFLNFHKVDYQKNDTRTQANILRYFSEYFKNGGFADFIKYSDKEFLKRIYSDILYRDLIARFNIRETRNFKQLAQFLFTNFTKNTSYNSIKKFLNLKSTSLVKNYVSFIQESYLIFELYKFNFSLKQQYTSKKKIFVIDNGLRNIVAFSTSEDSGRLLENLVFIELKRRDQEIYFYKNKSECDFLIKEKNRITQAIQVTLDLDTQNQKREIDGLVSAMKEFNLKTGLILTFNQEKIIKVEDLKIRILPVWKWLILEA
jgi:uncharacterized protein